MYNSPDKNKKDRLEGVSCSVTTCEYNSAGNVCQANGIKVGTEYAGSMDETFCSTFKKDAH